LGELMLAVLDILASRGRQLIPLLALAVVAGCTTTPNRAPVVDHSSGATIAPPAALVSPPPPSGPGYYTVKSGDTLYGIALQVGQDYRQLATWNNLDASFHIRIGQVLRVAPPDTGNGSGSVAVPVGAASTGLVERPLGPPGAPPQSPPGYGPMPVNGDLPEKNSPIGVKRPYSDAALADLSKPDSDVVAAAPPPVAAAGDQGAGDDENVGWIWPASGPEIAGFSEVGNKGVNIAGKTGAPVLASGAGTVLYVGNGVRGYGNLVVIKHNATYISVYAHNSKILVTEQQPIKKGQKIAEMGDSDADQVELHFEIRRQGKPVDPMKYLPAR
jgi:lipoprotein NlpD